MNRTQLSQACKVITHTYGRPFTEEKLSIWFSCLEHVPVEAFAEAIKKHLMCPEQGHFEPAPGSIMKFLVHSEHKIKVDAANDFDKNPCIDGTPSFDANTEDHFSREARKRRYIASDLEGWRAWTTPQKMAYSGTITQEQCKLIEQNNIRLEHHE